MDRTTQLDTTTHIIASRIPGAQPDAVKVLITEDLPGGGTNSWEGSPRTLAGTIQVALESLATTPDLASYTAPVGARANRNVGRNHPVNDLWEALAAHHGPERATYLIRTYYNAVATGHALTEVDHAKQLREELGPAEATEDRIAAMRAAAWYPLRPGDLVIIATPPESPIAPWAQTYSITEGTERGQLWMQLLHHTPTTDPHLKNMAGMYTCCVDEPLYEAWCETFPSLITVVRDGFVIPHRAV